VIHIFSDNQQKTLFLGYTNLSYF